MSVCTRDSRSPRARRGARALPVLTLALALATGAPVWSGTDAEGEAQPPAATTSLTQAMQGDSGIAIQTLCTNCNNADLSLGGLGNDHVAVTCDGLPVPAGLAQIYLLSIMPPTLIDKVAVTKGAGEPALGGAAIGGGIEIERHRPEGFLLNTSVESGEFGWRGSKLDVSGRSGRVRAGLAGTWATSDVIDANADGNPELPSYDRTTVEASADVEPARDHHLRFGVVDYDESQEDGPAAPAFGQDFTTGEFGFLGYNRENVELARKQYHGSYEARLPDGSHLALSAVLGDRSQDIIETSNPPRVWKQAQDIFGEEFFPTEDNLATTYLIDEENRDTALSYSRALGQRVTLGAGAARSRRDYSIVDRSYNNVALSLPVEELLSFAIQESIEERGAWLEGQTALGARVDLSLGVRWVDFSYTDNEAQIPESAPPGVLEKRLQWLDIPLPEGDRVLPRAAIVWKPADPLSLRVSAGAGFRAPDPIFSEVCCGRRYRGNRGVRPEESAAYGLELTWQPRPSYRLAASAFRTDFDDFVLKMATLAYQFRPTYQNVNVPEARHTSVTLEARVEPWPWLDAKASASWLDADNRTPDDAIHALIDFNGDPVERSFTSGEIPYTVEQRRAVAVEFRPPGTGLGIGITAQHTGPMRMQRFDAGIDGVITINPDLNFSQVSFEEDGFVESDPFWVVNLSLSKAYRSGLALYGGIDNFTDYIQATLGDPQFDTNWGPLRGRYLYAGLRYTFDR
jgi:outer membrane receptor protein involved in Fe transport